MSDLDKFNYECPNQISMFDIMREPIRITKPIRLIELFAGYGSQSMALRNIGAQFEHYRVVEFDKYAIASYNAVHGTDFPTMDITKVHAKDLDICDTGKYCSLMTYSFPCTDLSLAGKQAGMKKGSGTRSGLLWEVERILSEIRESAGELPQVLFMENVPQVHADANMADFQKWIDFLSDLGYVSYWQDLNAKDYGVAQNRNRCFMFSFLGEYNYHFPLPIPLAKRIKDYLEDEVDEKYYIGNEKAQKLIDSLVDNGTLPVDNRLDRYCVDGTVCKPREKEIANCINGKYDAGISNLQSDGNMVAEVVAMRGRNPENPSDRTVGAPTEQRLEPNTQGLCNCLTSVQKDNMLLESVKIKQATKSGSIRCEVGGCFDASYPESKTRRGRVQDNGNTCPTLTAQNQEIVRIESQYRIRKLTPRECGRLMGVSDEDISKMEKVNSNTQLYKQFGNSIVVDVMCKMFSNLNID